MPGQLTERAARRAVNGAAAHPRLTRAILLALVLLAFGDVAGATPIEASPSDGNTSIGP